MRAIFIAVLATIIAAPAAMADASPDWAARVKRIAGEVHVERDGARAPIKVGDRLAKDDVIFTGANSGAGLTFRDNSRVSVGPNASLAIAKFTFEPGRTNAPVSMQANLNNGLAAFVSGRITKRKPGAMQVRTPTAILGVRGTTFIASSSVALDK